MFCAQCGYQLPDNAAFCPGCGAKVVSAPMAQVAYEPIAPPADAGGQTISGEIAKSLVRQGALVKVQSILSLTQYSWKAIGRELEVGDRVFADEARRTTDDPIEEIERISIEAAPTWSFLGDFYDDLRAAIASSPLCGKCWAAKLSRVDIPDAMGGTTRCDAVYVYSPDHDSYPRFAIEFLMAVSEPEWVVVHDMVVKRLPRISTGTAMAEDAASIGRRISEAASNPNTRIGKAIGFGKSKVNGDGLVGKAFSFGKEKAKQAKELASTDTARSVKSFVSGFTSDASSSFGEFVHNATNASVGFREADEKAIERDCQALQELLHRIVLSDKYKGEMSLQGVYYEASVG